MIDDSCLLPAKCSPVRSSILSAGVSSPPLGSLSDVFSLGRRPHQIPLHVISQSLTQQINTAQKQIPGNSICYFLPHCLFLTCFKGVCGGDAVGVCGGVWGGGSHQHRERLESFRGNRPWGWKAIE